MRVTALTHWPNFAVVGLSFHDDVDELLLNPYNFDPYTEFNA